MNGENYNILGLRPGCTVKDVQSAWRKLSLTCHPDRQHGLPPDEVEQKKIAFQRITGAKNALLKFLEAKSAKNNVPTRTTPRPSDKESPPKNRPTKASPSRPPKPSKPTVPKVEKKPTASAADKKANKPEWWAWVMSSRTGKASSSSANPSGPGGAKIPTDADNKRDGVGGTFSDSDGKKRSTPSPEKKPFPSSQPPPKAGSFSPPPSPPPEASPKRTPSTPRSYDRSLSPPRDQPRRRGATKIGGSSFSHTDSLFAPIPSGSKKPNTSGNRTSSAPFQRKKGSDGFTESSDESESTFDHSADERHPSPLNNIRRPPPEYKPAVNRTGSDAESKRPKDKSAPAPDHQQAAMNHQKLAERLYMYEQQRRQEQKKERKNLREIDPRDLTSDSERGPETRKSKRKLKRERELIEGFRAKKLTRKTSISSFEKEKLKSKRKGLDLESLFRKMGPEKKEHEKSKRLIPPQPTKSGRSTPSVDLRNKIKTARRSQSESDEISVENDEEEWNEIYRDIESPLSMPRSPDPNEKKKKSKDLREHLKRSRRQPDSAVLRESLDPKSTRKRKKSKEKNRERKKLKEEAKRSPKEDESTDESDVEPDNFSDLSDDLKDEKASEFDPYAVPPENEEELQKDFSKTDSRVKEEIPNPNETTEDDGTKQDPKAGSTTEKGQTNNNNNNNGRFKNGKDNGPRNKNRAAVKPLPKRGTPVVVGGNGGPPGPPNGIPPPIPVYHQTQVQQHHHNQTSHSSNTRPSHNQRIQPTVIYGQKGEQLHRPEPPQKNNAHAYGSTVIHHHHHHGPAHPHAPPHTHTARVSYGHQHNPWGPGPPIDYGTHSQPPRHDPYAYSRSVPNQPGYSNNIRPTR